MRGVTYIPLSCRIIFGTSKILELAFDQASDGVDDSQQEAPTQLAWRGFSEDSIPGLVESVAHRFNELVTQAQTRNAATDKVVVPIADKPSQLEGSVIFPSG